jgi:hypothetical protein
MSYVTTIHADTPLHWWRLADGGGVKCSDLGSSRIDAIGSLNSLGYSGPSSSGGSAVVFSPGGFTVRQNMPLTDPFSAECWIWLTEDVPGAAYALLESDGVTAAVGYAIQLLTTRKVQAFIGASGAINGGTTLSLQTWHHICLTHDNANARLYVDGVQDAILALGAIAGWNLHYGIAEKPNATSVANFMFIAEVAHYNGALAPANVAAHHSAAEQPTQPPLYTGGGALSLTSMSSTGGLLPDVSAILAAVQKTFPTT